MDISAIASAGLDVAQSRFDKAATGIASASDSASTAPSGDIVSLSQQAVSLLSASHEFQTDLQLAHVADAMHKTTAESAGVKRLRPAGSEIEIGGMSVQPTHCASPRGSAP